MKLSELLFAVGDVVEHEVSGEKAIVAKIIEQPMEDPETKKKTIELFYTLSASLKESHMYPCDTAHGSMKKV